MTTWCSGWNAAANSLGRTSTPHVSVAIAAISRVGEAIQSIVPDETPGADPPAYAPAVAATREELAGAHEHDVAPPDAEDSPCARDRRLEVARR